MSKPIVHLAPVTERYDSRLGQNVVNGRALEDREYAMQRNLAAGYVPAASIPGHPDDGQPCLYCNAPWQPQGHTQRRPDLLHSDGFPGGDTQVAAAHSVRLVQREPRSTTYRAGVCGPVEQGSDSAIALITSYRYAATSDPYNERPNDPGLFRVVNQIEYMICEDLNDPGDTELWADYVYEDFLRYDTLEEADTEARELAMLEHQTDYVRHDWDGLAPFERQT